MIISLSLFRTGSLSKIAGWDSPDVRTRNIGGFQKYSFEEFETTTFFLKEAVMEQIKDCEDHPRMGSNTYYPPKGLCFRYTYMQRNHTVKENCIQSYFKC